jgi:hypothetical protein
MRRILVLPILCMIAACPAPKPPALRVSALATDWTMHVLVAADTIRKGADGVNLATVGTALSVCTGWEQGKLATVAALDGSSTATTGTNLGTVEDTICVDVDGDGNVDAVSGAETKKIQIDFGPGWTPHVVIGAATNVQRWMRLAWADVTGDGQADLLAGGRIGAASWGYFTTTNPRQAAGWTWHAVAAVGWTMTLQPIDLDGDGDKDVYLTDRDGAGNQSSLKGSWWYENNGQAVFTAHHIAHIPGDPGMGQMVDLDGDGDSDVVDGNRTAIWIRWNNGQQVFTPQAVPYPTAAGEYHAVVACDVDGDADLDLVTTYALSEIGESWVLWLEQDGTRHEVSGPASVVRKPDNPGCVDVDGDTRPDIIFAEGGDGVLTDDVGVGWFENPS